MNVGNLDFSRKPLAPKEVLELGPTQTTATIQTEGIDQAALSSPDLAGVSMETIRERLKIDHQFSDAELQNLPSDPKELQFYLSHKAGLSPPEIRNLLGSQVSMAGVDSHMQGGISTPATHFIAIGPPEPNLSMRSFIGSITEAMEKIMLIKAEVSQDDARVDMQMLRDTITQTQLKIRFQQQQNDQTVASLQAAIWAMHFVRIMMYLTMSIITAIMIAISIAVTVVTAGAGAPAVIAITASVISALLTAITTALMIIANEAKRKGEFNGPAGQAYASRLEDTMIALDVLATVAGMITGVGVLIATLRKIAQDVGVTILKLTMKETMKAISQMVAQMISQFVSLMGGIMQARSMTNASVREATEKAKNDYENSETHNQVQANKNAQLNKLKEQLDSGQINSASYSAQVNRINTAASVSDAVNLGSATKTAVEQAQKDEETLNWIIMGVTIGLSIASSIIGGISSSLMDPVGKMAESIAKKLKMLNTIQFILGFVSMFANALSTGLQGYAQVQMAQTQIDLVNSSLNARQMTILLDAFTTMWTAIEEDIEELMKNTQESFANLIKALNDAFDISGRAMDKIMQAF